MSCIIQSKIMIISDWEQLPDDYKFNYTAQQLTELWSELHAGDCYAFPLTFSDEYDDNILNSQVDAWLDYHNGNFMESAQKAVDLDEHGAVILAKSVAAYCDYLCEDEDHALSLLKETMEFCEKAAEELPDCANTQFVSALIMGRYSQRISITKALSQGLGGKVKNHLQKTLELEPGHAEAHTAMGLYHSEIIDKVGSMIGGLTYGAKKHIAIEHFEKSMELTPDVPITSIEYANGILLLEGSKGNQKAMKLYKHAASQEAADAIQACDISFANDQLD